MRSIRWLPSLCAALLCAGCAGAPRTNAAEEQLVQTARAWLELLDNQKYQEAWDRAAVHFKTANAQEAFLRYATSVRRPLGQPTRRETWRQSFLAQVRGRPDGQYFAVSFRTTFAHAGPAVYEHVILENEARRWNVSGYAFRGTTTHQFGATEYAVTPAQVFDAVRQPAAVTPSR